MHAFVRRTERQTDRQTDRWAALSSLYRVCILCSALKMAKFDPSEIQKP